MTQIYETHSLNWNSVEIEVRYCRSWSKSFADTYGHKLRHLEVRSVSPERAALPITETGYKSMFLNYPELDSEADPVCLIREILDEAARSPEWITRQDANRQMSFF